MTYDVLRKMTYDVLRKMTYDVLRKIAYDVLVLHFRHRTYFGKSPSAYFGKTSCHTIEITASRARPRLRLGPPSCRSLMPSRPPQSEARTDIASPCRQRAARLLDQLRVRGDPFLRHPRAAVDRVPGRQPRHGGAPTVFEQVLDVDGSEPAGVVLTLRDLRLRHPLGLASAKYGPVERGKESGKLPEGDTVEGIDASPYLLEHMLDSCDAKTPSRILPASLF